MGKNGEINITNPITETNGCIKYQLLSPDYLEKAVNFMKTSFYHYESACKALELQKFPEAIAELTQLTYTAARDGITVIAVDTTTDEVVSAAFNKLQTKQPSGQISFFERFANSCKHPRSRALVQFMIDVDALSPPVLAEIDCWLEIMFMSTSPTYKNRGICTKLCQKSLAIAEKLKEGINVKGSVDGRKLELGPRPQAVTAIFTSKISQGIGENLGFQVAARQSYGEFSFEGRKFSEIVHNDDLVLVYKML